MHFIWGDSPPNLPFLWGGGSGPPPNTRFLGSPESTTQTASRSVHPFLQGSRSCPTETDRQTDHATSVAIGRIFVPHIRCGLMITRCCSTDSEGPHNCCHLPNEFDSQITLSPLSTSSICLAFVFFAFCSSPVLVFY